MKKKSIPRSKLIKNRYYLGKGRNAQIGYWNGKDFLTIGCKCGEWVVKFEPYQKGWLCFIPYELIDDMKYNPERAKLRKSMEDFWLNGR